MHEIPPQPTRPARMHSLAVLPVFLDLHGGRVVVAGDGEAAAWKAELAAAAGAHVQAFSPQPCEELAAIALSPPGGSVEIVARDWRDEDLAGAALAIGALVGERASAFAEAARRHGVPVNVVDAPSLSSFSFGTIVNRSPVVIGISSAGTTPVLAQLVRSRIEALLHPVLGTWAAAARRLRPLINERLPMGPARRSLWQRFAERALAARNAPADSDLRSLHAPAIAEGGSVVLVGAGPGDPELLTLKALRALQSADVILYDRLVSPEILEMARREARRMLVGKAGGGARCSQAEINRLMLALACQGRRVVRLKGGDPMVFGRAGEEIDMCRAAGIPVEVVPGITAALGAAAELQVPLTHRGSSRRLQFVTGHGETGEPPEHDWRSLADPASTTVFYMGARTFAGMLPQMLAAGLDPAMPAIAITAATTPRSRHVSCAVTELPKALQRLQSGEPCLILVGASLPLSPAMAVSPMYKSAAASDPA